MSEKKKLAVIAFGGNALLKSKQKGTYQEQIENVTETCRNLIPLIENGYNIVIGHGNGPQVGNVMLQHKAGKETFQVEDMPLNFCVAETQGSIAYLMWFNSYLEQADEDDLIILFSYTGIYFDYEYPNRRIPPNIRRPKVWFITGNTQVKKSEYINEVLYFSSRQNQPSHPYQLQAVGDIIAQSYAHYLAGKQKPGE